MSTKTVLFYVQHLWGVGHVYRATRIASALSNHDFDVHLVWGGTHIEGFDFSGITVHYLAPVRTQDASFGELLHGDGRPFTDEDKADRRNHLLNLFADLAPDILMTEAFPFGRRQMRFELLPLMEAASKADPKPLLVSSIRDIMQEDRKQKRVDESCKWVEQYFDLVFTHGDERFIRLEETLQGVERFHEKVRYTGLVTPQLATDTNSSGLKGNVLISVGGGAFGQELAKTAVAAFDHAKILKDGWLLIAGSQMPQRDYETLVETCPVGMRVVRHLPNLVSAMENFEVSVSHAGYNTVADILRTRSASVLYPYTGGRETEQLRRAQIMQRLGLARMVSPGELTPKTLADAIEEAAHQPRAPLSLKLDGADQTAKLLRDELSKLAG